MEMKLKDHKEVAKVVLGVCDDVRKCCVDLASMIITASTQRERDLCIAKFKAYWLILFELEELISENHFDCLTARDDNEDE